MRKIKNRNLVQLLAEANYAPPKHRRRQLDGAEKLLSMVQPSREYPYEFVCYMITGFRPVGPEAEQMLKGAELTEDLAVFISRLSGKLDMEAAEQGQVIYTTEQLAGLFGISTKTISRWREKGLVARRYIFRDGKKRLGFLQAVVDDFARANPKLVSRAQRFSRLTKKQKQQVIKQATTLAAKGALSRHQIIEHIANKMNRAHETIRYTLAEHESSVEQGEALFNKRGVLGSAESSEIFRLYKQFCPVKELMVRFGRSKSSIYRIINRKRAKLLLSSKIEFITSEEFLEKDAEQKILMGTEYTKREITGTGRGRFPSKKESNENFLRTIRGSAVLNRGQEQELFRRYNYLKYLACLRRAGIKINTVKSCELNRTENYLAQAEEIKDIIIKSNLRLVSGIARKHFGGGTSLQDLISEGNIALMRAVEKFDYSKGFRFATYASWAIAKNFARKIPQQISRSQHAKVESIDDIEQDFRAADAADVVAVEKARDSLVHVIRNNLTEREQYIILNHFGVPGSSNKRDKKTLKQIGDELDLTKERVRQIELIALRKLRQLLSIEQFELLTG
jgi:RNA polymerase sigma factor (sigma-70 family)